MLFAVQCTRILKHQLRLCIKFLLKVCICALIHECNLALVAPPLFAIKTRMKNSQLLHWQRIQFALMAPIQFEWKKAVSAVGKLRKSGRRLWLFSLAALVMVCAIYV
jgi:hypothetical protein